MTRNSPRQRIRLDHIRASGWILSVGLCFTSMTYVHGDSKERRGAHGSNQNQRVSTGQSSNTNPSSSNTTLNNSGRNTFTPRFTQLPQHNLVNTNPPLLQSGKNGSTAVAFEGGNQGNNDNNNRRNQRKDNPPPTTGNNNSGSGSGNPTTGNNNNNSGNQGGNTRVKKDRGGNNQNPPSGTGGNNPGTTGGGTTTGGKKVMTNNNPPSTGNNNSGNNSTGNNSSRIKNLPKNTQLPGNLNVNPNGTSGGQNNSNKGTMNRNPNLPKGKINSNLGNNLGNKGTQDSTRIKLDKLPTAPKPDIKILKPGQGNLGGLNQTDLNKKLGNRGTDGKIDLSKVKLQHHLDVRPNRHLNNPISKLPIEKNGLIAPDNLKKINFEHKPANDFQLKFKDGKYAQLMNLQQAQQLKLNHQFQLFQTGDVARRMDLMNAMNQHGGWQARKMGFVSGAYLAGCHSMYYCGPGFYPKHCWYPTWSPWVDWCWWDHCHAYWDPRPIFCRPIVYVPCQPWVYWNCPVWQPLPIAVCGTWVDVPVVTVANVDVQMLAVRFVDPGHAEQGTGPRYRVWLRNNTPYRLDQAFNVMLFAGNDRLLVDGMPQAGVTIPGMDAGQTQVADIRLPEVVSHLAVDAEGNPVPFNYLTVMVDAHNQLPDSFRPNNGATLARVDVLPVDPASFAADPMGCGAGDIINIAGEGFGPEPGQVLVQVAGLELQGQIEGWFDLGVRIRVPQLPLTASTAANVVIIRGDGAAANPLTVELAPQDALSAR